MNKKKSWGKVGVVWSWLGIGVVALAGLMVAPRRAESQEMQQRLAEVKQSLAFNKQVLAQYTWMEQQIVSVKGEQKKEELFNVQMGPDGKPQKTRLIPTRFPTATGRCAACEDELKRGKSTSTKNMANRLRL